MLFDHASLPPVFEPTPSLSRRALTE
jgi:hypothetical protein